MNIEIQVVEDRKKQVELSINNINLSYEQKSQQ